MASRSKVDTLDKNGPLIEDIRLLGRILGEVIREQEGKAATASCSSNACGSCPWRIASRAMCRLAARSIAC